MTEIKLDKDKEWKDIDIFLFTNGEHSSPPRKHHLDTDSLMMWDGTLRNLGNSHYGPESTVVLYTINGKKIDDPSQLIHQTAYVAVQLPYTFIQADYENYLIKASRSWEKTLLRISNSKESTNKGNIEFDSTHSQNYDSSGGPNDQISKKETSKSTMKNVRSTVRPCILNVKPPQNRNKVINGSESIKQMQKKNTCNYRQSPSRKQSGIPYKITPASKKILIKTKESFSRTPLDIKKKFPSKTDEKLVLRSNKVNHYNQKIIPSTSITNFNVIEEKLKDTKSKEPENLNHRTASYNIADENMLNEKKLVISSIYKNLEKEITSVTAIKCDTTLKQGDSKNADNAITICDENHRGNALITLIDNTEKYNKEISLNATTDSSVKNSNLDTCHKCYETRRQLDHFVSILNNDKVLKLQLNLEIKNCNVSVTTEQINSTNETQSQRTIMREEKETQVNIFELSNNICCQNTQYGTTSVSKEDDFVKEIIKNEKKVIIISCTCCDCMGLHYLLQPNAECDKSCNEQILSGLISTVAEETERCVYEMKSMKDHQNMTDTHEIFATTNLEGDVDKTITITSVHKLSLHNAEPVTDIDESLSYEKFKRKKYSDVAAEESFNNIINTNTQTNWCNVMLEARHHADGRYTFHLPSLQKIKMLT